MGFLSFLTGAGKSSSARAKAVKARYDAAQTTTQNANHWSNADSLNPNEALSPSVRQTLRNRVRYEIANNPYARGLVMNIAFYVIGQGPKIQFLTENPEANEVGERMFNDWAEKERLAHKLRLARMAQCSDGEVFIEMFDRPDGSLGIEVIESDYIAAPFNDMGKANNADGIVLDRWHQPQYYQLAQGDGKDPIEIPAERMIHLYRMERPGQRRGLPELTAALPTFAQLRRYMQAVLSAAETVAHHSMFFATDTPPEQAAELENDDLDDLAQIGVPQNAGTFLPEGWKPFQLKAEQPSAQFSDTVHQYLAEIGRVCQIPAMIVTGDASDHNFASGRLDVQAFHRFIDVDRSDTRTIAMSPIVEGWRNRESLRDTNLPQALRTADPVRHVWRWPHVEHVDEKKAAEAAQRRIDSGVSSIPDEAASLGKDHEDVQRQQAKALGLDLKEYRKRLAEKLLGPTQAQPETATDD